MSNDKLTPESDEDFRLVTKKVLIMALEQLLRALDYEKEGSVDHP